MPLAGRPVAGFQMCRPRWACPEVATPPTGNFDDGQQAAGVVGVLDADPPWHDRGQRPQQHVTAGVQVVVDAERGQRVGRPGGRPPLDDPGRIERAGAADVERSPGEPAGDLGEVQHLGDRGVGIPDAQLSGAGSG